MIPAPSPPRVTIGFPVYNSALTVGLSLDALRAQTFPDFELIISDNASTDGTADVCAAVAARDPRVTLIRQTANAGALPNFAAVLEPARSEYFMWAAGDDHWHPRFLERCVETLDARGDAGVVFPRARITSYKIPFVSRTKLPHLTFVESDDVFERVRRYIELPDSSHKANAIYGVWRTPLARRTIDAVADVEPRMLYVGLDIAMMVYVLTQTKMVQLPEILFDKRSKWFPKGSAADRLMSDVVHWFRPADRAGMSRDHVRLIRTMLRRGGVLDDRYESILRRKQTKIG